MGAVYSKLEASLGRRGAIGVLIGALLLTARQALAARKKKAAGAVEAKKKDPQQLMWDIMMPKYFAGGEAGAGTWEMVGLVALNMWNVYTMWRFTAHVAQLDKHIVTRDRGAWAKVIRDNIILSIEATAVGALLPYLRKRLAVHMRRRLIGVLHKKYFDSAAYYHVEQSIKDADTRMTQDADAVAKGFAEYVGKQMHSIVTGLFYTMRVWMEYGLLYTFSIPTYIVVAGWLQRKLNPTDWSVFGYLEHFKSTYRGQHTRMVMHNQAIAALRGEAVEEGIVTKGLDAMMGIQTKVHDVILNLTTQGTFWYAHLLGHFFALFVLGPGVFTPAPKAGDIEAIANTRSDVGKQFMLTIQIASAAWNFKSLGDLYNKTAGNSGRLAELVAALDKAPQQQDQQHQLQTADDIAFEGVDIKTPTGVELVRNLTFRVGEGCDSLLLTGHNGAGKSSIFRCLAGLWATTCGAIRKPKGGLNADVFYLPQKPYNVLGTLPAQLTYPRAAAEVSMTEGQVRDALTVVGLGYVADRPGVFTDEVNWEEQLSLGEQQRLAIARLILQKPRYAILDECTSGVTREMERKLYQILHDMEVSYITISHRPVLRAVHARQLYLKGDEEKGYSYSEINSGAELKRHFDEQSQEIRRWEEAHKESGQTDLAKERVDARSAAYRRGPGAGAAARAAASTALRLRRLLALCGVPRLRHKVAVLLVGLLLKCGLRLLQLYRIMRMYHALFARDRSILLRQAVYGVLAAVSQSAIEHKMQQTQQQLQRDIMNGLSRNLVRRYMKVRGFYRLPTFEGEDGTLKIKDPETRLTDDVRTFAESTTDIAVSAAYPLLEMALMGRKLYETAGSGSSYVLYGTLMAVTAATQVTMPNFKTMTVQESEAEGKLKFWHSRVRAHAESIAFFGGGHSEHDGAKRQFDKCADLKYKREWLNFRFEMSRNLLMQCVPGVMMNQLRFNFAASQFGDDASIQADGGASLTAKQNVIYEVNESVKGNVQKLVDLFDRCDNFAGTVQRLAELEERIVVEERRAAAAPDAGGAAAGERKRLAIRGVDIVTPAGDCLAHDVSVEAVQGADPQRVVVTGPNASGKTALFRLIAGLWPVRKGAVDVDGKICFVSQKPYSVTGTLLDQVLYPACLPAPSPAEGDDMKQRRGAAEEGALELLKLVGVEYLVERWGEGKPGAGWYAVKPWEQTLSLGEQQRIGMARMFHKQPDFAVLDECTDAVSVDVERALYAACARRGINCVTISKRLTLEEYHEKELRLGEATESGAAVVAVTTDHLDE